MTAMPPQDFPEESNEPNVQSFLGAVDFNKSKLHPMSGLGGIDYIYLDETAQPGASGQSGRGLGDDLCYGTGTMYLTGKLHFVIGRLGIWRHMGSV